jgi:hypothetical protein
MSWCTPVGFTQTGKSAFISEFDFQEKVYHLQNMHINLSVYNAFLTSPNTSDYGDIVVSLRIEGLLNYMEYTWANQSFYVGTYNTWSAIYSPIGPDNLTLTAFVYQNQNQSYLLQDSLNGTVQVLGSIFYLENVLHSPRPLYQGDSFTLSLAFRNVGNNLVEDVSVTCTYSSGLVNDGLDEVHMNRVLGGDSMLVHYNFSIPKTVELGEHTLSFEVTYRNSGGALQLQRFEEHISVKSSEIIDYVEDTINMAETELEKTNNSTFLSPQANSLVEEAVDEYNSSLDHFDERNYVTAQRRAKNVIELITDAFDEEEIYRQMINWEHITWFLAALVVAAAATTLFLVMRTGTCRGRRRIRPTVPNVQVS